jgi:hypothetical protein
VELQGWQVLLEAASVAAEKNPGLQAVHEEAPALE